MKPQKLLGTARAAALACLAFATAGSAQDDERRTTEAFDVGGNGEFSLSNVSGDIRVEGASGGTITVEAIKTLHGNAGRDLLDEVEVDISHTGDRVRIETRYPRRGNHRRRHRNGGVSVEYRVSVPTGTEVELGSVSGDVNVSGVEGETSIASVSGDVTVVSTPNLVSAKSVSGEVDVSGARSDEDLEIESVSGTVTLDDVHADELDVTSVSGDIRMDQVSCDNGEFGTVSGNIRYSGRIVNGGQYEYKSHSGNVVIIIGDDVGFELEASTFSGDIESDFPMRLSSGGKGARNITAIVGDGGAVIEATTFSGNVDLRSRR